MFWVSQSVSQASGSSLFVVPRCRSFVTHPQAELAAGFRSCLGHEQDPEARHQKSRLTLTLPFTFRLCKYWTYM